MVSSYRLFASSITQGSFQEGGSLPFDYFWHTEYAVFLVIGIFSILAVSFPFRKSATRVWAAGFLFIYLCLTIPSVIVQYFVVYGRLARQLMPFLVLLSAQGMAQMEVRLPAGRRMTFLILGLVLIQAAWNYTNAFRVSYPREFSTEVQAKYPDFEFSSKRLAYGAPVVCQYNGYALENTKFYVTPPEKIPHVQGELLLSAPHPTNYLPYLYEGDPPPVRQKFRALKLRMSFYRLDAQFMSASNPEWTAMKSCVTGGD